jgi:protein-L-isoaspartate(D-aspartate) O-methyltransferase
MESERALERFAMVSEQIAARGVSDPRVLGALKSVQRHLFVPEDLQELAYDDRPLAIGYNQTISQPYIVGFMSEAAGLRPGDRVLEIGTGSGYQTAILAELTKQVYSIEIIKELSEISWPLLRRLYPAVQLHVGDGYNGWPGAAPFDVIFVTAAPDHIPKPLMEQLREGGRIMIPVGSQRQQLLRLTRRAGRLEREELLPVTFVPMTGLGSCG